MLVRWGSIYAVRGPTATKLLYLATEGRTWGPWLVDLLRPYPSGDICSSRKRLGVDRGSARFLRSS